MSEEKIVYQPYKILIAKTKGITKTFDDDELKQLSEDIDNLPPSKANIIFGLIYQHHLLSGEPEGQVFGRKGKRKGKKKIEYPYNPDISGSDKKDLTYNTSELPGKLLTILYEYIQLDKDITSDRDRGSSGPGGTVSFVGISKKKTMSE